MDHEINLLENEINKDPQNRSLWFRYLISLSRIEKEDWRIYERFLSKWQYTSNKPNLVEIFPLNTDMRLWRTMLDLLYEMDYTEQEIFPRIVREWNKLPDSPEKLILMSEILRKTNDNLIDYLDGDTANYLRKIIPREVPEDAFSSEEFEDCRFFIVEIPETSHWSDYYKDRVYAITGTYLIDKEQNRYLFTRHVNFLESLSANTYDIYRKFDRDEEADEISETIEEEWRSASEDDYMNQRDVRNSAIKLHIIDAGDYDPEDYDNDEELRNQVREDHQANPVF